MRPRPAPRSAEYASEVITELKSGCKSKKARIRMAEMAISMGNYTDEGRAVWRDYLAAETA
jgi:hypothetical protein